MTAESAPSATIAETETAAHRSARERQRVIYVMGAGRSGSTTLGITLGNCSGVFYAGELDNWLARCGAPQVQDDERSLFWRQVRENLANPIAASELFGMQAQRSIERSLSLFRVNEWRSRWRLRKPYRSVAEDLFRSLSRVASVDCVADTSHYPLRARELQHAAGLDLYLLFLVRDPQGVVASFNRHDVNEYTKSTLHTNFYLIVTHLLSLFVFLRHPRQRRLFVRYEDFVSHPGAVIGQILQHCDCPAETLPDFGSLEIGVPLQGNRVTRERKLTLKGEADPLPRRSRTTAVLQAPMMALLARLARPRVSV